METEYPKILASQESSTMASTWTEYLRLDKEADNGAVLEICQYEVLGEMQSDEEGNQILPPDIDPEDVVRIEDGYICGGALTSEFGESFQIRKRNHLRGNRVAERKRLEVRYWIAGGVGYSGRSS
ncbi:hypothetical protein [Bradyrhizobium sp. McL0616]|uniref:hypothetical protein n=1 Tax=Bradyrhizobium sp. McL0616 TaxID=3415674 RepID=UPI003CE8D8B7